MDIDSTIAIHVRVAFIIITNRISAKVAVWTINIYRRVVTDCALCKSRVALKRAQHASASVVLNHAAVERWATVVILNSPAVGRTVVKDVAVHKCRVA